MIKQLLKYVVIAGASFAVGARFGRRSAEVEETEEDQESEHQGKPHFHRVRLEDLPGPLREAMMSAVGIDSVPCERCKSVIGSDHLFCYRCGAGQTMKTKVDPTHPEAARDMTNSAQPRG